MERCVMWYPTWSKRKMEYVRGVIETMQSACSFKDMDIMLMQVQEDTGYRKEFLAELIEDRDEDESLFDTIENVIMVAYEFDY